MFVQPGFQQQPQVAQQQPQVAHQEVSAHDDIEITQSESGSVFFVHAGKNDALKKKLKEIGGVFNSHKRGYRFFTRDLEAVLSALKEFGITSERPLNLVDPRTLIEVTFTQQFQWGGDMKIAEERLTQIGLTKQGGRGNLWNGDLSKAGVFLQAFGIAVAAPQTQPKV